jgi:hypothetical protein
MVVSSHDVAHCVAAEGPVTTGKHYSIEENADDTTHDEAR